MSSMMSSRCVESSAKRCPHLAATSDSSHSTRVCVLCVFSMNVWKSCNIPRGYTTVVEIEEVVPGGCRNTNGSSVEHIMKVRLTHTMQNHYGIYVFEMVWRWRLFA